MSVVHHAPVNVSIEAAEDLTESYAVNFAGEIANATDMIKGCCYKTTKTGSMAPITIDGECPGISGAAFAVGAYLKADANGKWIAATAVVGDGTVGAAIPTIARAQANEAATAADQTVNIRML